MASFSNTHWHDDTCVSELVNLDHDAIIKINIRMTLFLTCISVDLSTCLSISYAVFLTWMSEISFLEALDILLAFLCFL